MVTQTSLLAYQEVLLNLGERQLEVLRCLNKIQPATNMMIAEELGWSINRVTPRIFELRKLRLVEEDKKDICIITQRLASYWRFNRK